MGKEVVTNTSSAVDVSRAAEVVAQNASLNGTDYEVNASRASSTFTARIPGYELSASFSYEKTSVKPASD